MAQQTPPHRHRPSTKKHGNVVRLGPNVLSLADPSDIKLVYGIGKRFNKSAFYEPFSPYPVGSNVFSEQDVNFHATLKKPIVSLYSMTSLTNYEPYIDKQIETFLGRLDEKLRRGGRRANDHLRWLLGYNTVVLLFPGRHSTLMFLRCL